MRVLLIDIDSLRPDHLGCYGYDRDTSPTIDSIAADGVHFEECYVSDSPCLPSRTALATCRHGIKSGVVTHFGTGQWYDEPGEGHAQDSERPLSFRYLSEHGIHTTTVTGFSKRHLAYHFTASFRESIQPTASTGGEDATDVTETALGWLDRHATEDDWLLHVNYWDVHHPYDGIDPFVDDVRNSGSGAQWPDQDAIDDQQGMTGSRTADLWPSANHYRSREIHDGLIDHGEWGMPVEFTDESDIQHVLDGYDASIRRVDAAVGRLLDELEQAGVRDDTAIVITGDHGDALGEHGIYAEHAMAHPPCQRVPMIVSWPDMTTTAQSAVAGKIYQFDLLPTICEVGNLDIPAVWDARSFASALRGEPFGGRDHLVCGHGIFIFSRAVYKDEWVYIRLLHPGVFSLPGVYNDSDLPDEGLELLHNLHEDPYMTENRLHDEPEITAELRTIHDSWNTDMLATDDCGGEDPLHRMAVESGPYLYVDPDKLEELYRELGRTESQRDAVARHTMFPITR